MLATFLATNGVETEPATAGNSQLDPADIAGLAREVDGLVACFKS